jgi:photoactive yellow protein
MEKSFQSPKLAEWLKAKTENDYDQLEFGLVKMDVKGIVTAYNRAESEIAGVKKENAIGKHFFTQIAPCTNNFMVAEKYKDETLDELVPYIFTYITKPTKVTLRLLKDDSGYQYLLVQKV